MKKALSILLTLVMLLGIVFSLPVTVYAEEGDGTGEDTGTLLYPEGDFYTDNGEWMYRYNSSDTITIIEYFSEKSEVEVPAYIDGKVVTEVASGVFTYTPYVTKLIIPETVIKIDYGIFWGGSDIAEFEIHQNNPVYEVRANAVVERDTDTLVIGSRNTKLTENDNIKVIGHGAFNYNNNITTFIIPDTVEKIDENAFLGCGSLESIEIPASVQEIGAGAFHQCSGLTVMQVAEGNPTYDSRGDCNAIIEKNTNTLLFGCNETVIPDTVTAIAYRAFYEQYGYTNADFHEGLVSIGEEAFFACEISEISIPKSLENIGVGAFSSCDNLYSITVAEGNSVYDSRNNCNAIIETETDKLITGCKKTVIPDGTDGVVTIGHSAFEGALLMYKMTVPASVTTIEEEAFFNCNGLRRLTIINPECEIQDIDLGEDPQPLGKDDFTCCGTISNSTTYVREGIVICAEQNSKAYYYSLYYGCPFININDISETKIYFVDSANWEQLKAEVLNDSNETIEEAQIHIGDRIESTITNDYGEDRTFAYYEITLDLFYDYIQFSNGGEDSTEIEEIIADRYYNQADGEWYSSLADIPDDSYDDDWEDICDHVDEDEVDNYCDICGEFIGKRLGEVIGYHMVLSDKLELFYHIQMSEEILADENAQVVFETPNGETKTYLVSQGVPDNEAEEDNVYIYSCEVAAKEMRSLIGATLVSGDDTESLMDYCVYYYLADIILSNYFDGYHTEEVSLVKALLNYGAASQMYFNYDTDKLANSIGYVEYETGEYIDVMTDEDKRLDDVYLDDFKGSVTGSEEGIEYYGSTISLESGTDIKHYFLIEKGTEIPVAKVYYKNGEMLGEYELKPNGDLYQLKIAGIFGQDLDEMYTVKIGGMTIEYGAFSYGAKAMEQQGAQYDTMKNVVKALHAYNIEAEEYLETV